MVQDQRLSERGGVDHPVRDHQRRAVLAADHVVAGPNCLLVASGVERGAVLDEVNQRDTSTQQLACRGADSSCGRTPEKEIGMTITVPVPDALLDDLADAPEDLGPQIRLAAAVHL